MIGMLTLIDYDYYSDIYEGSSIPESSFQKKAIEASSKVNYYTFNRITEKEINNNIKNATCEVAELIYSQEKLKEIVLSNDKKIKLSETVGPHSVNYVNKSSAQEKEILNDEELENSCYKICLRYLANTGLMYRGF